MKPPATYSPQDVTDLRQITTEKILNEVIQAANLKTPEDYQIYDFDVAAVTPPHDHGLLRAPGSPFPIILKPLWGLMFLEVKGNWTIEKKVRVPFAPLGRATPHYVERGAEDCGPEGYSTDATKGCLYRDGKLGQLILCEIFDTTGKKERKVDSLFHPLIGGLFPYNGLFSPQFNIFNLLTDRERKLFPFMNDHLDGNGKSYRTNGGSLHCKVVAFDPKKLFDAVRTWIKSNRKS